MESNPTTSLRRHLPAVLRVVSLPALAGLEIQMVSALMPVTVLGGHDPSTMRDGLYPGISRTVYERIEAANYSTLKFFNRTPAHAQEAMLHPYEPTEAMNRGTAAHKSILEPAAFADEYIVAPKVDRRTKAGKEQWTDFEESNRGRTLLDEEDMDAVRSMTEQVYAHDIARQILSSPGKNEIGVVWTDKETGLRCKALLDRLTVYAGWTVAVDVKTCRDAGRSAFARQAANLLYHEQSAFYLEGLNAHAPMPRRFIWLAVENERPHCAATYEPDPDMLREGKLLFRRHLETLARCRETNRWAGYPATVEILSLPRWAVTGESNGVD